MKERTNRILFLFIIPMSIALISSYLVGNLNAIFFADVGHREKITIKVYDSQTKTTLKNVEISFLRFFRMEGMKKFLGQLDIQTNQEFFTMLKC
jgi:hypothetical protein